MILLGVKTKMSDSEEPSDEEQRLKKEIDKEIDGGDRGTDQNSGLFGDGNSQQTSCENHCKAVGSYFTEEELKIERGLSPRTVRQWKKDMKSKYAASVSENERLRKC